MKAKYLVRFDDICPTMSWSVWAGIELVLAKYNIKPILAVIPDNCDSKLMIEPARLDFWERVRAWQAAGWTIAIHGYQHLYETQDSGLMGINAYSEFAGLPYDVQQAKLVKALAVFARQGVHADAWIAPAHAFDATTVKILLDLGVKVISDGFYWRPVKRLGALWVPQQLWEFGSMPFGVWTVCYHHNSFSKDKFRNFELNLERFAPVIISMDQALRDYLVKEINPLDSAMFFFWLNLRRLRQFLKRAITGFQTR